MNFEEPSQLTEPTLIASDELEPLQHTPLELPNAAIWLIHVEPDVFLEDAVSIALFEEPLDSAPSYAALSYSWGSPISDHEVSTMASVSASRNPLTTLSKDIDNTDTSIYNLCGLMPSTLTNLTDPKSLIGRIIPRLTECM